MIKEGTRIEWSWGQGTATGKVIESYDHEVSKTFKGNQVTRKGETGNLALLIEQEDGSRVLKLSSEVERADG